MSGFNDEDHDSDTVEVMKKGESVFVYGTLRKGERADLAASASKFSVDFLGNDRINGLLYHLGGYPGLKLIAGCVEFTEAAPMVLGEVFFMKDASVGAILDAYEAFPYLYGRSKVLTETGREVWVYTYNGLVTGDQLLETGDWKNPRLSTTRGIPEITISKVVKR